MAYVDTAMIFEGKLYLTRNISPFRTFSENINSFFLKIPKSGRKKQTDKFADLFSEIILHDLRYPNEKKNISIKKIFLKCFSIFFKYYANIFQYFKNTMQIFFNILKIHCKYFSNIEKYYANIFQILCKYFSIF